MGFSQGKVWKDNRKMFMGTLTAMGMGNKNKMEPIIQEEVLEFCTLLKDKMQGSSEVTVVCIYFFYKEYLVQSHVNIIPDKPIIWSNGVCCSMETDIWYSHETK